MKMMKKFLMLLFFVMSLFSVQAYNVSDFNDTLISSTDFENFKLELDSKGFASLESYNDYKVPKKNGEVNLLDYLGYDSSIRDQGNCGSCWVWASMFSTEIALSIEVGIKDRLSIQHFDSNYQEIEGDTACDGGEFYFLDDILNVIKKVIPWSNDGAEYKDLDGDSKTSTSSISEEIYYPILVEPHEIQTSNLDDEEVVNELKGYIDSGKAIGFAMYYPQEMSYFGFAMFWHFAFPEDVMYTKTFISNETRSEFGGHGMNIVGYNEIGRYWIVQNSWGTGFFNHRPTGTFKMSFDMNYDLVLSDGVSEYEFWVYDYEFGSEAGLRVEPEVDAKINIDKIVFDKATISAGEVITSSVKVNNDYEYMNLQNVRVSYFIPKLGMKRTVGPFDVKMFEDVMKRIYLDIPRNAKPGMYDVRIVLQTENTKEVRYEEIEVK